MNGGLQQNEAYSVTDFIPVTAGEYHLSEKYGRAFQPSNTCINLYDSKYEKISTVAGGETSLTIPFGVSYIRVSVTSSSLEVQIEQGDARTAYEPYSPIWGYIPNIPDSSVTENKLADISIGTSKLKSSSVTGEKIADKSVSLEKN